MNQFSRGKKGRRVCGAGGTDKERRRVSNIGFMYWFQMKPLLQCCKENTKGNFPYVS